MFVAELQQVRSHTLLGFLRKIYIAFQLSQGYTLPQWWLVTPY